MTSPRRLHKSRDDRVIFGVAGGIAEYFEVDPVLVRVGFVLFTLAAGSGIWVYLALALILPAEESEAESGREVVKENMERLSEETSEAGERIGKAIEETFEGDEDDDDGEAVRQRRRDGFAFLLITLGAFLLFMNFGLFFWWRWDLFWPVVLIAVGAAFLIGRGRRT